MTPVESNHTPIKGCCTCGASTFQIAKPPTVRFLCHCTICQKIYGSAYSDVTLLLAKHVKVLADDALAFDQYKQPPALDRGICQSCSKPVVGFLDAPLTPRLAFIPAANLPAQPEPLPQPSRHIHYGTRVADVHDALPKTSGELASNLVLMPTLLRVVLAG